MTNSLPFRFLFLALLLTTAGCASTEATKPTPKHEDIPVARKIEKVEEPVAKKPELPVARKGEQELSLGIRNYAEANYKVAAGHFQNALDAGLSSRGDQLIAHKYLAFIYCVSGEELACRGEFKQVLKLNPKYNLPPAEAGHPIWGPVFRALKQTKSDKQRGKK